jgi:hypothetical protein
MSLLSEKGALLNLEFRKGCDFQFTINTEPYDLTGSTAEMHLNFDGIVHPVALEVIPPFQIYVDIPHDLSSTLPIKSRHLGLLTEADGDVKPLWYGDATCLVEPE